MSSTLDFESKVPSSFLGRTSFSMSQKLQCSFVYVCVFKKNVERLSRKAKQNTSRRFNRFYGVVVSTLDSESKDPRSNLGRTSFSLSQKPQCTFVYVVFSRKFSLSRKFNQNTSRKFGTFYCVVVSILDFESKNPSSNLGKTSFSLSEKLHCSFVYVCSL